MKKQIFAWSLIALINLKISTAYGLDNTLKVSLYILVNQEGVSAASEEPTQLNVQMVQMLNNYYQNQIRFVAKQAQRITGPMSALHYNVQKLPQMQTLFDDLQKESKITSEKDEIIIFMNHSIVNGVLGMADTNKPEQQHLANGMGYRAVFTRDSLQYFNGVTVAHEVGHLFGLRHVAASDLEAVGNIKSQYGTMRALRDLLQARRTDTAFPSEIIYQSSIAPECNNIYYTTFGIAKMGLSLLFSYLRSIGKLPQDITPERANEMITYQPNRAESTLWPARKNVMSYSVGKMESPQLFNGNYADRFRRIISCELKARSQNTLN